MLCHKPRKVCRVSARIACRMVDDCAEKNSKKEIESSEGGATESEQVLYTKCKGRLIFSENNTVVWEDDEENAADGMVFTFGSNAGGETGIESDLYLSESEAFANVKQQAGSDAENINAYKGHASDGF